MGEKVGGFILIKLRVKYRPSSSAVISNKRQPIRMYKKYLLSYYFIFLYSENNLYTRNLLEKTIYIHRNSNISSNKKTLLSDKFVNLHSFIKLVKK